MSDDDNLENLRQLILMFELLTLFFTIRGKKELFQIRKRVFAPILSFTALSSNKPTIVQIEILN